MKYLLFALLLASSYLLSGQGDRREIALDGATAIHIYAEFSSVTVTTGGQGALAVHHTLTVDGQDRPDLRQLTVERHGTVLHLREVKPTAKLLQKELPDDKRGMISGGREGGKGSFNNVMVDATLEVVVPAGIPVTVATRYGGIKAVNVAALASARARYGAVDVIFNDVAPLPDLELYSNYGPVDLTIPAGRGANLDLTTQYGDLLTDLEIQVDPEASKEEEFYQHVIGTISGGGNTIKCEAPYGDVYLREG